MISIYLQSEENFHDVMPRGFPELKFSRHVKGISGVAGGKPFGNK
jgi:hypothetical protein